MCCRERRRRRRWARLQQLLSPRCRKPPLLACPPRRHHRRGSTSSQRSLPSRRLPLLPAKQLPQMSLMRRCLVGLQPWTSSPMPRRRPRLPRRWLTGGSASAASAWTASRPRNFGSCSRARTAACVQGAPVRSWLRPSQRADAPSAASRWLPCRAYSRTDEDSEVTRDKSSAHVLCMSYSHRCVASVERV